jgi:hypothetical protein
MVGSTGSIDLTYKSEEQDLKQKVLGKKLIVDNFFIYAKPYILLRLQCF